MDVFDPHSLHLLQPLDQAAHEAAQSLQGVMDPELRRFLFGRLLSNGCALAASLGWIFATATALVSDGTKTLRVKGAACWMA